jgi:hypothetical protein
MQSDSFPVDILVNGNPCKIHFHQGKHFVEAKEGSEYEILVKNNSFNRALVVSAVDGLNVLDGKPASPEDIGYVVNAHSPLRIKGFRYSDEKVAAFKFSSKDKSYAASKGTEAAANVGGIGIRIYWEYVELVRWINTSRQYDIFDDLYHPFPPYGQPSWTFYSSSIETSHDVNSTAPINNQSFGGELKCCLSNTADSARSASFSSKGFDMGTEWGKAKEQKVVSTQFKRGSLLHEIDIYYASRESLLEMGVPLTNEIKVNFPNTFPRKYAEPPSGWREA